VRRSMFVTPIALCLLFTPAPAQTAKSHYDAGELALKAGRWVDAGREFEQAAKLAPDNNRYQSRYEAIRTEVSEWAVSAARLLMSADRNAEASRFIEDALRFDPNNAAAVGLLAQLNEVKQRLEKLYQVQTVYVGEITGTCASTITEDRCAIGEMTREQIKAALANTGRFRVILREDKGLLADATITGRAELKEVETQTTTSAQAQGTTRGAQLGTAVGGTTGGMFGGVGKKSENTSEHSTESKRTLTSESVVLSLALKSGEVVWGWDDTKACSMAKAKCAVNDLVNAARR